MAPRTPAARRPLPGSPFNVPVEPPPPVEPLATGDRVSHDRHGMGRVVGVDGDNIVVDFGEGANRLVTRGPKLHKL